MNPPEQAPALQQIYEARRELVRQNEAEIADLKHRLEQATERNKELVAQLAVSKENYEEAASKIVDLLDDEEERGEDGGGDKYREDRGNESKQSRPSNSKKKTKQKYEEKDNPTSNEEDRKHAAVMQKRYTSRVTSPLKATPSNYAKKLMMDEVVDLVESDDNGDNSDTDRQTRFDDSEKNVSRTYDRKRRTDDSKETATSSQPVGSASQATKRSRSSSPIPKPASSNVKEDNDAGQKRAKSLSPDGITSNSRGKDRYSKEQPDMTIPTEHDNSGHETKSPTNMGLQSLSNNGCGSRGSVEGKSATVSNNNNNNNKKKRGSSALTRRIKLRPRPSDVPPEQWLKSSVGRTREELNTIEDMVQYMGSCQFGQSVVVSKFGKVHAVVLNDEWNALAQRNDEYQIWYVGLGPGRKRDARLVGASPSTIPIFQAPKVEHTTRELFYVGHYKVKNLEELDPPIVEMEKERDMRVTFAFEKFDKRLDSIIKQGPKIGG
jgi:hypothetical protein